MSTPYINNEAEEYFQTLEENKEALEVCYRHICDTINRALAIQDYELLFSLISYIESGAGHLAFEHIGEARIILRVLNIIALEHKYLGNTFASNCACLEELMDKYRLTLFAFRRVLFRLSDSSIDEAVEYLQGNVISHFAVYMITKEELLVETSVFYEALMIIYAPYWEPVCMEQFRLLTSKAS